MKVRLLVAAALLLLPNTGCVYYKITDTASGKEYVTNNWVFAQSGWNGATRFTDLKTNKEVTLQSYERQEIPSDEAKVEIETQKN